MYLNEISRGDHKSLNTDDNYLVKTIDGRYVVCIWIDDQEDPSIYFTNQSNDRETFSWKMIERVWTIDSEIKVIEPEPDIEDGESESLRDQIQDILFEDRPMSEEGYAELVKKWMSSSAKRHDVHIDKYSYSVRRGEIPNQEVYLGKDRSEVLFDPFASVGEGSDEHTDILNSMSDYVLECASDENDIGGIPKRDRIREAKESEGYLDLKRKLKECERNLASKTWSSYRDNDSFSGVVYGSATEANMGLVECGDRNAYVFQTRLYTSEHGFQNEGKKLSSQELTDLLLKENDARDSWLKQTGAVPAIGPNTNTQSPISGGLKKKSPIKRLL